MAHTRQEDGVTGELDFERLVHLHYTSLYRFALSLTRRESDARDLTQQTFYVWATKGHQLHDRSKVKAWLFTTLHREFLESHRRQTRFPHHELGEMEAELPRVSPVMVEQIDGATIVDLLAQVDEVFQAPVALFYLEDYSYNEIAGILEVPLGTVKSRISRGLAQLHGLLAQRPAIALLRKKTSD